MMTSIPLRARAALTNMLLIVGLLLASLGTLLASPATMAAEEVAEWPADKPIVIGSKADREGYLLGEMFAQVLEDAGYTVERRLGLGQTIITYQGLAEGELDVYPEYTGTLAHAILKLDNVPSLEKLDALSRERGLKVLKPLGFNNTYAISMRRDQAESLGIATIGDLAAHPELSLAMSHEFVKRSDGWPGLAAAYDLPQVPRGIEHGIAYQALRESKIDGTDAYSTEGDIKRFDFVLLEDDKGYFPEYLAVPFVNAALPEKAVAALNQLAGSLDEDSMQALNAEVSTDEKSFAQVASRFIQEQGITSEQRVVSGAKWDKLGTNLIEHLQLTLSALLLACLVGLPLSLLVYRNPKVSRVVLYVTGLLQTIPSIALLALMIPLFGIGVVPAVIALFVYSLLPIIRSAITALLTVDPLLVKVARGMGLTRREQLRHVILPLATPNLLTGIKTAAIINIGTATLAAFIGAGGLGEPIVTGLSLNDYDLVLYGAIPAALLAICAELLFELFERMVIPAHMRGLKTR
ncbi:glycine betaine ABC transporter substrate-binding protein [Cobetia crustatorum]|nr:glycine betaine ABC transporter substrate-binding protein [Cobetia crustatorum]